VVARAFPAADFAIEACTEQMCGRRRAQADAKELIVTEEPVVPAGDYNVIPTEIDVYKPKRWVDDALFLPEVPSAHANLVAMGWTDAVRRLHPDERIYTFSDYSRNAPGCAMPACASIVFRQAFQPSVCNRTLGRALDYRWVD
jgi:exonuclease III